MVLPSVCCPDVLFRDQQQVVCAVLALLGGASNTFTASLWWVDFVRFLGMQTHAGN